MKKYQKIALLLCIVSMSTKYAFGDKVLLNVPVTNLLSKPFKTLKKVEPPAITTADVPFLVTQLLLGERLRILKEYAGWIEVEALEQVVYKNGKLKEGCLGWISRDDVVSVSQYPIYNVVACNHLVAVYAQPDKKSNIIMSVSIGTKFVGQKLDNTWWIVHLPDGARGAILSTDLYYFDDQVIENKILLRKNIVEAAMKMEGVPFCWHCRSSYDKNSHQQLTGMGCDGLINLAYRINGLEIPRFAADQYAQGIGIDGKDLKPGDLIFFGSKKNGFLPHHAMFYLGDDQLLEATYQAPAPDYPARIISCYKRLGKPISMIKNGEDFGNFCVYFCSYLEAVQKIKTLRKVARYSLVS